jgi:hypothetical protein
VQYTRQNRSGAAILHSPQTVDEFKSRRAVRDEVSALREDIDTLKREILEMKALLERKGN